MLLLFAFLVSLASLLDYDSKEDDIVQIDLHDSMARDRSHS